MPITLTLPAARALLLAAQNMHTAPTTPATKDAVLAAIRHMHVLQIDTIHVVARSPYFVLWSRLGAYEPQWLDDLLAEGALFEYWAHAACFLPREDYALYTHPELNFPGVWAKKWAATHSAELDQMRTALQASTGGVRSSDFERTDGRGNGWWDWKPEKTTLEALFFLGEVMVARRHNFQRIYDLRDRVYPGWRDLPQLSRDAILRTFALKSVTALGVTRADWVGDYFRTPRPAAAKLTARLADEGALLRVAVEGWDEPGYIHPANLTLAEAAANGTLTATYTTLLSPFDPVVWHRARASDLFNFDYLIECYTPAAKRRYGYFTLPILHRDALVGRVDAKAHRAEGRFELKHLHLEPRVPITDDLLTALAHTLHACAAWHGTPAVTLTLTSPRKLAAPLRRALKNL